MKIEDYILDILKINNNQCTASKIQEDFEKITGRSISLRSIYVHIHYLRKKHSISSVTHTFYVLD